MCSIFSSPNSLPNFKKLTFSGHPRSSETLSSTVAYQKCVFSIYPNMFSLQNTTVYITPNFFLIFGEDLGHSVCIRIIPDCKCWWQKLSPAPSWHLILIYLTIFFPLQAEFMSSTWSFIINYGCFIYIERILSLILFIDNLYIKNNSNGTWKQQWPFFSFNLESTGFLQDDLLWN